MNGTGFTIRIGKATSSIRKGRFEDVTVTIMDEHDGGIDTLLLDVRNKLLDHIHIAGGQDIPLLVGHTSAVQRGLSGIGARGILGSPYLG
jgi:hypothetical protein